MEDRGETDAPEGEKLTQEEQTVVQSDNMVMWVGGVTEYREGDDDAPVLVEISVDQENNRRLCTSYGVTDDGGGVAVALTLIRHAIHHPRVGVWGPSLLFRSSNYDIVRHYADHAPFPHASVFVSDAFGLGLLNRFRL
ncbi:hypothetical protein BGZ82_003084 [Podila clonocystis]|nr:hypothetical protein BGZ82_003084 [Podila clonocystis]